MSHNDDTRSHAAAGTAGSRTLKRSLSHGQMTMIVMGSALGTGLFLGSGTAIAMAGPAVILTYAIGSALASVIGAATGEMAVATLSAAVSVLLLPATWAPSRAF